MKWNEVQLDNISYAGKRNGGTKIMYGESPLRFQIPTGKVLYNGLSEWKSLTIEVPPNFIAWWTNFEKHSAEGLQPFSSNAKDSSLRVKIDPLTHFFDGKKVSFFPNIEEGLLKGAIISCIIEVSGVYFFQGKYGLTVRAHQIVVRDANEAVEDMAEKLTGFAFI